MEKNNRKILIITPLFYPLFGGMEEQCYILGREFIRKGYQVDILTERTKKEFLKHENIDGITVYRIGHGWKRNLSHFLSIAIALTKFTIARQEKYQFCIIRTLTFPAIFVGLLKFLKISKLKTIVTAETGGKEGDFFLLKKHKFLKEIVFFLNRHNYLNGISEEHIQNYKELGFMRDKITKLYNGIDVSPYSKAQYPSSVNNFLFIGRLVKEKGIKELLEASQGVIAKHPNTKLFIGGDGPERKYVEEFIQNNKLQNNIKYLEFVSREQKPAFFKNGECVVLPSYYEGFPISIIEATVYKRFIIATDVSDLKELYRENIILCKKHNPKDLESKMIQLIKYSKDQKINYDAIVDRVDIRKLSSRLLDLSK